MRNDVTLNTITLVPHDLHLTAHCRCWTCEHVGRRQHVNKFWAHMWSEHPRGLHVENVKPVVVNTGGPPLPRKRAPTKKMVFFAMHYYYDSKCIHFSANATMTV